MPDPAQPPSPTVQYEGLVGKSTRGEDHWRLYISRDLSEYIEFNEDDVLSSESITKERSPMGLDTTRVWLKRDVTITRAHARQVPAAAATEGEYAEDIGLSVPEVVPTPLGDHRYNGRNQLGALAQGHVYPDALAAPTMRASSGTGFGPEAKTESAGLATSAKVPFPGYGDHFYTIDPEERRNALDHYGYSDEGIAFWVYANRILLSFPIGSFYTRPLYRLAGPNTPSGDHFYTISSYERDDFKVNGYRDEGVACYVLASFGPNIALPSGLGEVKRLFHPETEDHFYTISEQESRDAVNIYGYQREWDYVAFTGWSSANVPNGWGSVVPFYRMVRNRPW